MEIKLELYLEQKRSSFGLILRFQRWDTRQGPRGKRIYLQEKDLHLPHVRVPWPCFPRIIDAWIRVHSLGVTKLRLGREVV